MRTIKPTPFQTFLNLADLAAVQILASTAAGPVPVWLDGDDAERLDGKRLHIGSHGYAQLYYQGQATPLHRWILGAERGDGRYVDHLDGNPLDNRKANLRFATSQMNACNRRTTAASGYLGVRATSSGRWDSRATLNGRTIYLGTFDSPDRAADVGHEWRVKNLPGYLGRDRDNQATSLHVAA